MSAKKQAGSATKIKPTPARCEHCFGTGKETDHAAFGAKMRKQRMMEPKVDITALASEMGISGGYLSDLERGKRKWTLKTREKFEVSLRKMKEAVKTEK